MSKVVQAAHAYVSRGWTITPLRNGAKNPDSDDWATGSPVEAFRETDNLGVILGHPSSMLVDVDLDTPEAVLLAPWFLPKTECRFGRLSKPESHWVYTGTSRFARVQYKDPIDGQLLLEIRGEGHQTMFPPSIHPSGEEVKWADWHAPTEYDIPVITDHAGALAAAVFFVRHWKEWPSSHHTIVMHLAGGLARGGWDLSRIENFVGCICRAVGDHEPADRLAAVRSTYDRYDDGQEVTGWPSLIEVLDDKAIQKLRDWLGMRGRADAFPLTDEGNAQRIAFYFGDMVRYVPQWNTWAVWDGVRWKKDVQDVGIMNVMRETVGRIWDEVAAESDSDRKEKIAKWAIHSQSLQRMLAGPKLARSIQVLVAESSQFDSHTNLFNVGNGVVNLDTGGLQPHDRMLLMTKVANVRFHPAAQAPMWEKFLERVLPDENTRLYVQKAAGYTLSSSNEEQVFFILYGGGNNGKSQFLTVIEKLFGDYKKNADVSSFLKSANGTETRIRTDIARLEGARLVTTGEPEDGQKLSEAIIKKITGGDVIVSRFLYGPEFEYRATYKLWIATNVRPQVRANDAAMWRRIRIVPFETFIPEEERIKDISEKIFVQEASGVLNWLLAGYRAYSQDRTLKTTELMDEAQESYRSESDTLGAFCDEFLEKTPGASAPSMETYNAYKTWCAQNGEKFVISMQKFKERLAGRGIQHKRTNKGIVFVDTELHASQFEVVMPSAGPNPFAEG